MNLEGSQNLQQQQSPQEEAVQQSEPSAPRSFSLFFNNETNPAVGQFPVAPMPNLVPAPQMPHRESPPQTINRRLSAEAVGPAEVKVHDQPDGEECLAGMPMIGLPRPRIHTRVCSYVHPSP
jgi:hypothetical protein